MLNNIINAWVKYVNNRRILVSITSGHIVTENIKSTYKTISTWLQRQFINLNIPYFSSVLSTHINLIYNLLNKSFTYYPQHLLIELINEN